MTIHALTDAQAAHLNRLSNASHHLRSSLADLGKRTAELLDRAEQGLHMVGFDSDLLGQPGREAQHYASVRAALLQVGGLGIDDDLLLRAITATGSHAMPYNFRAGEQPASLPTT